VPCNRNGTLPDGNREAFVARHFYKEAAGPKKRSGSFMRHSHGAPRDSLDGTSLHSFRLRGCEPSNAPRSVQAPGVSNPIKRLLELVSRRPLHTQFQVDCVQIYIAAG